MARALDDLALAAPDWGLHSMDVNLALGDLIEVVDLQAAAWTAAKR